MSYEPCYDIIPVSPWLVVDGVPGMTASLQERFSPWVLSQGGVDALARVPSRLSGYVSSGCLICTEKREGRQHAALFVRRTCPQCPIILAWDRRLKDERSIQSWESRWTDERIEQLAHAGQAA